MYVHVLMCKKLIYTKIKKEVTAGSLGDKKLCIFVMIIFDFFRGFSLLLSGMEL